jgi:hypothetical protein
MLVGTDSEAATHIRSHTINTINTFKPPLHNMTKGEREVIKNIKKNGDITIMPADKGRLTVLIPTDQYENKMAAIVSDTTTYRQLPGDPALKHKKTLGTFILNKVKNKEYIKYKTYHKIYPTTHLQPCIQGHEKVHKEGGPLRPIVAGRGSITSGLSKELTRIIQPTLGKTPYHLKDSEDLKQKIGDMIIPPTHMMVSFDVTNMYTKIPQNKAVEVIRTYLLNDPTLYTHDTNTHHHRAPPDEFIHGLLCLEGHILRTNKGPPDRLFH